MNGSVGTVMDICYSTAHGPYDSDNRDDSEYVVVDISQHHKISYSFITSTIPHIIQLDSVDERLKGLQDKRLKSLQDKRLRKGRFIDCYELMSGGVFDYKL